MPRVQQPEVFQSGIKIGVVGAVVFAGAVIAWCYWGHNHVWTAMKGPTEVSLDQIAKLESPKQLPSAWVKVKFDKAVKSDVVLEETHGSTTSIDNEYLIFQAGDRWMIASVPPGFDGNEISGEIWQQLSPLARDAVKAVSDDLKEVHQGKLSPLYFDASEDYVTDSYYLIGIIAMLGVPGLLMCFAGFGGVLKSFQPPGPQADFSGEGDDTEADFEEAADSSTSASADVNDTLARILRDSRR